MSAVVRRERPRQRFRTLLVALIVLALSGPFLSSWRLGGQVLGSVVTLVLLAVLVGLVGERRLFRTGLAFAAPAVALRLVELVAPGSVPEEAGQIASLALTGFCVWVVYASVMAPGPVDQDRIVGAVVVLLLLGYFFAEVFSMLQGVEPGAFRVPDGEPVGADGRLPLTTLVYFSFVTLTTLGFGDISPVSESARTVVWLEAVVGQLFLAVTLARLVALQIAHEGGEGRGATALGEATRDLGDGGE